MYSNECFKSFFDSNFHDKICLLPHTNYYKMNHNNLVNYYDYAISIQNDKIILSYVIDNDTFTNNFFSFLNSEFRNRLISLFKNGSQTNLFSQNHPEKKYIFKKSVILKLYEMYGHQFEDETEKMWMERFMDDENMVEPLKVPRYKYGNAKNLLYTILSIVYELKIIKRFDIYAKNKWGLAHGYRELKDYASHPLKNNIKDIITGC